MKIYNYSEETGEFKYTSNAAIDPIDGGYLIPAFATLTAPPAYGENQAACYVNGIWQVLEDNRGAAWDTATREMVVVSEIGPMPDGLTKLQPVDEYSEWNGVVWVQNTARKLADRQSAVTAAIIAEEDRRSWLPIEHPNGSGVFHKSTSAITETIHRFAGMNANDPLPINNGKWDDVGGNQISFTYQDLIDLRNAIYDRAAYNYGVRKYHIAMMLVAADPLAYDYSGGWR